MSNEGALANLDDAAAIERIASGTLSKVIAAEFGVTPFGLRKRLAKHPDYKEAVAQQAHALVEDAVSEIFSEELELDAVAIARARVRADTAFKYAKAHNPDYADKSLNLNVNVTVEQAIQFDAGALLDSVRVIDQARDSGATMGVTAERIEDNSDDNQ
jgi:hypothetical protein